MILNFPLHSNTNESEAQQFNQQYDMNEYRGSNLNNVTNISNMSPVPKWNENHSSGEMSMNRTNMLNGTMSTTMMGQSLKSQNAKPIPLLKPVDNTEMDSVPK